MNNIQKFSDSKFDKSKNKHMKKNTLEELVGTSNPTQQENQTTAAPGSTPVREGKLEDVFTLRSSDYPLEQHECKLPSPAMLPDQLRRFKEDLQKHGLNVPVVICRDNSGSR